MLQSLFLDIFEKEVATTQDHQWGRINIGWSILKQQVGPDKYMDKKEIQKYVEK